MRAVLIRQHGGPEVLTVEELPSVELRPGEVRVHIHAAALNRMDLFLRDGLTGPGVRQAHLPHIPGADGAGIVDAVSAGVDEGFVVGDRVAVFPSLSCRRCLPCRRGQEGRCPSYAIVGEDRWGTHAEYVVLPSANVLPIPDHVSFTTAAAAPVAFTTAWTMLNSGAHLRPGEVVLVVGASGGVATAAVQLAHYSGARVIATTRGTHKAKAIATLPGVDTVVDSSLPGWSREVLTATNGRGADVAVDATGAPTWPDSIRALAIGGRLTICGATGGDRPDFSIRELYQSHRQIVGAPFGGWDDFASAMAAVFNGVEPVIHTVLPLEEVAEAHRLMAADSHVGKVVLDMS